MFWNKTPPTDLRAIALELAIDAGLDVTPAGLVNTAETFHGFLTGAASKKAEIVPFAIAQKRPA